MPKIFKCDVKVEADLEVTKTLSIQAPTQDAHAATKKYVDDVVASDISTSTTNFNGNLSSSDNTIQKALDTLDNLSTGAPTMVRITDANSPYSVTSGDKSILAIFTSSLNIDLPQITSSNNNMIVEIFASAPGVSIDAYSGQKILIYSTEYDTISSANYFNYWCRLRADNTSGKWYGVST